MIFTGLTHYIQIQTSTQARVKTMKAVKIKMNPYGMEKVPLPAARVEKLHLSLQYMSIMSELIKMEYKVGMDADFRDPVMNNLANRIGNDSIDLAKRLRKCGRFEMKNVDESFLEDYTIEMYRVFQFFIGLRKDRVEELLDGWEAIQENVVEQKGLHYITIGLTEEESAEVGKLANRKGLSDGLKTKLEGVIVEINKTNQRELAG